MSDNNTSPRLPRTPRAPRTRPGSEEAPSSENNAESTENKVSTPPSPRRPRNTGGGEEKSQGQEQDQGQGRGQKESTDTADTNSGTAPENSSDSSGSAPAPRRSRPRLRTQPGAGSNTPRSRPRLNRPADADDNNTIAQRSPRGQRQHSAEEKDSAHDENIVDNERTSDNDTTADASSDKTKNNEFSSTETEPSSKPPVPVRKAPNARRPVRAPRAQQPTEQGQQYASLPADETVASNENSVDTGPNTTAKDTAAESSLEYDESVDESDDDEFEEQFASFFEDDDDEIAGLESGGSDNDAVRVSPASVPGADSTGTESSPSSSPSGGSRQKGFDKNAIISKYAPLAEKRKLGRSSDDTHDAVAEKVRYRHHTEQGTVTARQIQFYRNLNLTLTYDQHKVADLLAPPTDKQETPEEKARRERLITQAIGGEEALRRGSKLRITDKDVEALRFLASFKFSNARNVAKMFSENEDTTRKRLNRLRDRGLVLSNKLYGLSTVYFLSEEGMVLSGYAYKTIKKSEINPASFPHTAGVTHLAASLIGADVDVLGFRDHDNTDWPTRNRLVFDEVSRTFVRDFGEMVSSEFEIQTWLGKRKGNTKGEIYKPKAQADIAFALREWNKKLDELKDNTRQAKTESEKKECLNEVLLHANRSPEMMYENEWMWALFPRNPANLIHHVPDLVVKRPRDTQDGSPRSIAVELELTAKNDDSSYVKTLTAYKNDKDMYAKVVWISPTRSIRKKLQKISDQVGLTETGKFRVMPLYYEHGEWPVSEHLGKI